MQVLAPSPSRWLGLISLEWFGMLGASSLPGPSLLLVTRWQPRYMERLARCSCHGPAALSFYLREAGVLDRSPAGIYRGALNLPSPLAPAPTQPWHTKPSRNSAKERWKRHFVYFLKYNPIAISQFWRQNQPRNLKARWCRRDGMLGKRQGCENANGPHENLPWEVLHKAAEPWHEKEMIKTPKWCFDPSFGSLAARHVWDIYFIGIDYIPIPLITLLTWWMSLQVCLQHFIPYPGTRDGDFPPSLLPHQNETGKVCPFLKMGDQKGRD